GEVNEDMYWSFGCNAIIRLVEPFMYRFGLANIKLYKDSNVMAFGTGVGGDIMYYWQVPMAFAPYGFGGLWFFNYSYDSDLIPNSSILTIRLGVGGEMVAMYNLFLEGGLDFQQVSDDGSSDSVTPFFIRGGVRFPLFR
ncbi:hypothetical protein KAU34_11150, partial [candidate division WOR-3 bacterium]|nr:hypothetical protein [candidate division WOR-3 bacterium]